MSGPKAVSRRQAAGRAGPEGGREKDQPATSTWMRVQYKNINTFITCSYFLDLILILKGLAMYIYSPHEIKHGNKS